MVSDSNPNGFDTPEIIKAIQNPQSDLVTLSAHRGIHALAGKNQLPPEVPENSLWSILYAAASGWEMIELDVKLTSDGTAILSHDKTAWGCKAPFTS
jgi:glycerophosphoryl diester phosphodiesterase